MILNDNVVSATNTVMIQKENTKTVMLQVDIKETTRTRLKLQAVRLGITMGSLTEQILSEALDKMEKENNS